MIYKKIAHFVIDDKFTDAAFIQFETVNPGHNDFFLISNAKEKVYIKKTPVSIVNVKKIKKQKFLKILEKYDFVVFHALTEVHQQLLSVANEKIKFVWIGMGYDYYDLIVDNRYSLYFEETEKILKKYEIKNKIKLDIFKRFIKKLLHKKINKKDIIKKIDYFSPVLEVEYDLISEKFKTKFPKYVSWNYHTTSKLIDQVEDIYISGDDILLGNSATFTNNHSEVLGFLKNQELNGKQIICPLSYGNAAYAQKIEERGKYFFGDKFIALREFMPFDEYMGILSNCSNVIMNHLRQQGAGNVSAMLYMGAKIFLNKSNPLYIHYISIGLKIFSMDELYSNLEILDLKLTEEEICKNKNIIKSSSTFKAGLDKTKKLIEIVGG
ncbi:tdp-n-acetylfucosamine:lipid ii n-acetylfucosaminyltransferase [Desulfoluna spongiiphila]|nr:tdp-n-acetylfucosamine:lipid ii n-acetylfucosaminyltransferase [Desulfoluna spongiiphila]